MIAAVRVRGDIDVSHTVSRTLQDLNLTERNQCVVFEENDAIKGMLDKSKDFLTYGEVSDETLDALAERAGKEEIESGDTINLHPPKGGFQNTKRQVAQGGSLGERETLDELIQKMV